MTPHHIVRWEIDPTPLSNAKSPALNNLSHRRNTAYRKVPRLARRHLAQIPSHQPLRAKKSANGPRTHIGRQALLTFDDTDFSKNPERAAELTVVDRELFAEKFELLLDENYLYENHPDPEQLSPGGESPLLPLPRSPTPSRRICTPRMSTLVGRRDAPRSALPIWTPAGTCPTMSTSRHDARLGSSRGTVHACAVESISQHHLKGFFFDESSSSDDLLGWNATVSSKYRNKNFKLVKLRRGGLAKNLLAPNRATSTSTWPAQMDTNLRADGGTIAPVCAAGDVTRLNATRS